MKKISIIFVIIIVIAGTALSETLSEQQQQELIDRMLYLRGEAPRPVSLESVKSHCGTQIAFGLLINRNEFTGKYAAMVDQLASRPARQAWYDSPGGHFRIHYDSTGPEAVYQANIDTIPTGGDGIPDYVNKTAEIADSAWAFEVDHLGFPPPISDSINGGGMHLVDIYIDAIADIYYGWTQWEQPVGAQSYTSFIVIDNDYGGIAPYNQSTNMNRRLDAVRVTVAHEFFHTIHYTMDWTEYEYQGDPMNPAQYWWEMSAVWMEEMLYDDINDYYAYLLYFYDEPWKSLQAVLPASVMHQYGAAVFPIFLTEKYDTLLIRDIWERCRDYGVGPNFPQAAHDAIDSASGGTCGLNNAFQEFAVWNYFTGSRAAQAPVGYSYSEAADYITIPDSLLMTFNDYDVNFLQWPGWPDSINGVPFELNGIPISFYKNHMPQNMGAHYIMMNNLDYAIDSMFSFGFYGVVGLNEYNTQWNFSYIKFPTNGIDPVIVELHNNNPANDSVQTNQFSKVVAVASPVSTDYNAYFLKRSGFGYSILLDDIFLDTATFVSLKPPYPNPIVQPSADANITFEADINVAAPGKMAIMEITIYNIAGEKINFVVSEYGYYHSNSFPLCTAQWYLDNQSGNKVSPGVYLAYYYLKFGDGTPPVSDKFKIAIIK